MARFNFGTRTPGLFRPGPCCWALKGGEVSARASEKKVRRAGGKLWWLGDSDTGFAVLPAGTAGKPL